MPDLLQSLKQSKLGAGFRLTPVELELDEEEPVFDDKDAAVVGATRGRECSSDALFSSPPPAPARTLFSSSSPSGSPRRTSSSPQATPAVASTSQSIESDNEGPVPLYDQDQESQPIRPSSSYRRPTSQPLSPVAQGKQRERSNPVAVVKVDLQSIMRGRRGTPISRPASAAPLDKVEGEEEIADEPPLSSSARAAGKRPLGLTLDTSSDEEGEGEVLASSLSGLPSAPVPDRPRPASPERVAPRPRKTRTIHIDSAEIIGRYRSAWSRPVPLLAPAVAATGDGDPILGERASISAPADVAERELTRTIVKADFATMEPLGQFNMGFIIARKRAAAGDDLFIIDQHASDEKYNFETLQNETRILSQGLIQYVQLAQKTPGRLRRLTSHHPADLAYSSSRPSTSSSFKTTWTSSRRTASRSPSKTRPRPRTTSSAGRSSLCALSQSAKRPSLTSLVRQAPLSLRGTLLTVDRHGPTDLEELLHLMKDQPSGQMVRCSKARAMFAMRACRKSVMVGRPLTKPQMTKVRRYRDGRPSLPLADDGPLQVVRNMGLVDQPWVSAA